MLLFKPFRHQIRDPRRIFYLTSPIESLESIAQVQTSGVKKQVIVSTPLQVLYGV